MAREGGVPYGRTRCTLCGALGVNRVTCTGDVDTHAALAGPYRPQVNTGNGGGDSNYEREYDEATVATTGPDPSLNEAPAPRARGENPATLDEIFTGEIVYTPPAANAPAPGHNLVKTTLVFITTTPIALENAARLAIQEADLEHIWLDTDFEDVTV